MNGQYQLIRYFDKIKIFTRVTNPLDRNKPGEVHIFFFVSMIGEAYHFPLCAHDGPNGVLLNFQMFYLLVIKIASINATLIRLYNLILNDNFMFFFVNTILFVFFV